MSWGNKILVVFICFAGLIFFLVYKSINTHFDLVTPKYYEEELKYEDHIDAVNNASKIGDVQLDQSETTVTLTLPKEMQGIKANGQAWFYSNTDASKDKYISFATENCVTVFEKTALPKGHFLLKLSWKAGNENYYVEKNISL